MEKYEYKEEEKDGVIIAPIDECMKLIKKKIEEEMKDGDNVSINYRLIKEFPIILEEALGRRPGPSYDWNIDNKVTFISNNLSFERYGNEHEYDYPTHNIFSNYIKIIKKNEGESLFLFYEQEGDNFDGEYQERTTLKIYSTSPSILQELKKFEEEEFPTEFENSVEEF